MNISPAPWKRSKVAKRKALILAATGDLVAEVYAAHEDELGPNVGMVEAAPALYDACKAILEDWHGKVRNMERVEPQSVTLARAALRKAESVRP